MNTRFLSTIRQQTGTTFDSVCDSEPDQVDPLKIEIMDVETYHKEQIRELDAIDAHVDDSPREKKPINLSRRIRMLLIGAALVIVLILVLSISLSVRAQGKSEPAAASPTAIMATDGGTGTTTRSGTSMSCKPSTSPVARKSRLPPIQKLLKVRPYRPWWLGNNLQPPGLCHSESNNVIPWVYCTIVHHHRTNNSNNNGSIRMDGTPWHPMNVNGWVSRAAAPRIKASRQSLTLFSVSLSVCLCHHGCRHHP